MEIAWLKWLIVGMMIGVISGGVVCTIQGAVIANLRRNLAARNHVLECIANTQITDANKYEVLDLCVSMARFEMEKIEAECSADGK